MRDEMWRGAAVERWGTEEEVGAGGESEKEGDGSRYMKRFGDGEIQREVLLHSNSVLLFRSWVTVHRSKLVALDFSSGIWLSIYGD
jgi:hypothetical protein